MPKSTKYVAKETNQNGRINYSVEDDAVWRDLVHQQQPNVSQFAAAEYLAGQKKLDLPTNRVPQCIDVSKQLRDLTGWQVQPVPALIAFAQFFSMLSNKTFPAASFIRTREDFDYIEEPDIFHEIYGHTPLLTDERFAKFSEFIGKAGLECDKADYSWLIRLYWFTIEFGLIRQQGELKALGSGLASSPTELIYSIEDKTAIHKPFDAIDILRTPYRIDIHQPIYFVLEDADQLFEATERNLLEDIRTAQRLGLHAPSYPAKQKAS